MFRAHHHANNERNECRHLMGHREEGKCSKMMIPISESYYRFLLLSFAAQLVCSSVSLYLITYLTNYLMAKARSRASKPKHHCQHNIKQE